VNPVVEAVSYLATFVAGGIASLVTLAWIARTRLRKMLRP
jgi:hypothetical protein